MAYRGDHEILPIINEETPLVNGGGAGPSGYDPEDPSQPEDAHVPPTVTGTLVHWEHADVGIVEKLDIGGEGEDQDAGTSSEHVEKKTLGQWRATSIAGNDITSSVFYTIGVATHAAGKYTPFSIGLVVTVLFFFREVYGEVCTALPLNGGTYNVLLNTTSKGVSALAAGLSLLSYLATAVVSANSAANYFETLWPAIGGTGVFWVTIIILGIFAILNLIGLSESANVAFIIFVGHLATLATLVGVSVYGVIHKGGDLYTENWRREAPHDAALSIYFGYATALLGVSGFESSANYIEEQKDGVYPKTLRNMWICVAIFNPIISVLALGLMSVDYIVDNPNQVLAMMARKAGAEWMAWWVSIDAIIVLSGAVLTSYVGVTGLARRMSMDRCLPQFLQRQNRWTKTNHWIIILFFLLTFSLMAITGGKVTILGGVYTIAFLSVMALFSVGNMIVKYKRSRLPRTIRASWFSVLLGLTAVLLGLVGNILFQPSIVLYFAIYFIGVMIVVFAMFGRIRLMRLLLFVVSQTCCGKYCGPWLRKQVKSVKNMPMVFFAKTDDIALLNKVILYVEDNEITALLRIVHVYKHPSEIPPNLEENVRVLDTIYPKMKIDLVLVHNPDGFNPEIVDKIAKRLRTSKNFMFMTCPSERFAHSISQFGGIRVITH